MTPPAIVDSHCHLDFDVLSNDIDGVIARAHDAGVHLMVTISTRVKRHDAIRAIAEAHPEVYFTVGTHPHNAHEELDVTAQQLVELSSHPKCVGIGEAGLDYFYDNSPRDAQAQGFRTHIAAARAADLPLVIHSRDAEGDTADILDDEMGKNIFISHEHLKLCHVEALRHIIPELRDPLNVVPTFFGIALKQNFSRPSKDIEQLSGWPFV